MRNSPASQLSDTTSRNAAVGRASSRCATGMRSASYESSSAASGPPAHDERELPRQVVGVLQAGVHALRADRAVDVRRVAEQEAAAVRGSARRAR